MADEINPVPVPVSPEAMKLADALKERASAALLGADIFVCDICGSIIADVMKHAMWHEALNTHRHETTSSMVLKESITVHRHPRPGNVEPMAKAAPSVPGRRAAEKAEVRQLLAQPLIPKTPPPGHRPGTKDTRMTETNIDTIADEIERTLTQRGGVTPNALQNLLPFATDAAQFSEALTTLYQQERAELEYVGGVVRWCLPKERTVVVATDQDDVSDILLTVEALSQHQLDIGRQVGGVRPLLYLVLVLLGAVLFVLAKATIVI